MSKDATYIVYGMREIWFFFLCSTLLALRCRIFYNMCIAVWSYGVWYLFYTHVEINLRSCERNDTYYKTATSCAHDSKAKHWLLWWVQSQAIYWQYFWRRRRRNWMMRKDWVCFPLNADMVGFLLVAPIWFVCCLEAHTASCRRDSRKTRKRRMYWKREGQRKTKTHTNTLVNFWF